MIAGGCAAPGPIHYSAEPNHVLVLPGILGHTPDLERIRRVTDERLVGTSAQVWDWTRIKPHVIPNPVAHIVQHERNRYRAHLLAQHITEFRREHPDVRLSIVALSGGAAIAVFTLEALPDEITIDRLVLLSGAVSPEYDLTQAWAHVERDVVNYHSPRDRLILDWGTTVFGTGDRVHSAAAGNAGFDTTRACPTGCDKMVQIEWHEGLRALGNRGTHVGSVAGDFVRECVVEWLRGNLNACAPPSGQRPG
jgi:pimeloyl-ACP methyl ester carboxylesterase